MIKTIEIGGKQVTFKTTGGTIMRYRNQFNSEFLADLILVQEAKNGNMSGFSYKAIEQVIWALAKTADNTIPDPQAWYDSFEEFPLFDVFAQLQDMITSSFKTLRKNA